MKMIHSEILVSMRRVVELSRTTENQVILEVPENVSCLSAPGHAPEEHLVDSGPQNLT